MAKNEEFEASTGKGGETHQHVARKRSHSTKDVHLTTNQGIRVSDNTQLPGHLPDEVLGLINNWVLHKISDANVIQRLRKIIPAVDDGTWTSLPNLASGHALASFAHMTRPVLATVDPTPCKLLMVE